MLTDDNAVEKVMGSDEFISNIKEGAIVIDMSSVNPVLTIKYSKKLKEKKINYLDAPVSGGTIGAEDASFQIPFQESLGESPCPLSDPVQPGEDPPGNILPARPSPPDSGQLAGPVRTRGAFRPSHPPHPPEQPPELGRSGIGTAEGAPQPSRRLRQLP